MQVAPPVPSREIDTLAAAIAAEAGISVADLRSRTRRPRAAAARHQLIRELYALGYQARPISRAVGINHATVLYVLGHTAPKPNHKRHEPAPESLPAEHWIGRCLPIPATAARIADPDQVAMTLPGLTDTERRQVAAYLTDVLLADRPRHSGATLAGLKLLASCPQLASTAAHYLVNVDRTSIDRQYWRDSAAGILARMQLQGRQVDIRWTTVPTLPPAPVPAATQAPKEETPMPRIEFIAPNQVPKPLRDSHAVDEAVEWLTKAHAADQALVVHLLPNERLPRLTTVFKRAAKQLHLRIRLSTGPERRMVTSRTGKSTSEASTLYVRIEQSAAKLQAVV